MTDAEAKAILTSDGPPANIAEADWWSEKWAQRRADWLNYKEEKRGDKD